MSIVTLTSVTIISRKDIDDFKMSIQYFNSGTHSVFYIYVFFYSIAYTDCTLVILIR